MARPGCGADDALPERPGEGLSQRSAWPPHNPDPELFEHQVESIRAQTHAGFVCLVSDDASEPGSFAHVERACAEDQRFVAARSPKRLGFYGNFERALSLVPDEADCVAFSDQDDVWHPDKLETLVAAIRSGAQLAYSDMNIVSEDGELIAPSYWTYWTDRRNNCTDLGSLIMVNTVTGAASLFRRELLNDALAFPIPVARTTTTGSPASHLRSARSRSSIGRCTTTSSTAPTSWGVHEPFPDEFKGGLVNALVRFATSPRRRVRNSIEHAPRYYREDVLRVETVARALEERLGDGCGRRFEESSTRLRD